MNILEENIVLKKYTNNFFGKFIADDNINEICYNGENLPIMTEDINGVWHENENTINFADAMSYAQACASYKKDKIDKTKPILSTMLPSGERLQIVIPPVVEDKCVSITIRKPSKIIYTIDDYIKNGSLSENMALFLKESIEKGKNVVICGETGSGKTTFMKTLVTYIPRSERLISIEDTRELVFAEHTNRVHLVYPSEAKSSDLINSASLLKSCLRMKPSRILLAELRGGETYDFLNVLSSGHGGSMTSCHAGSVKQCQDRLVMMAMQHDDARVLGREMIAEVVSHTIDIIVVFKKHGAKRQVVEYLKDGEIYSLDDKGEFHRKDKINKFKG